LYRDVRANWAGLLFEGRAGLFDFGILAFDFDVLLGQKLGLFSELLVRQLQLLLLALQLFGQRLRLLEQVFGARVGFDGVDHDPDALRQLVEECQMGGAEALERRQFQHGLDLSFEQHRDHDDVQRGRLSQAGCNLNVIGRSVGNDNLFLSPARTARPAPPPA